MSEAPQSETGIPTNPSLVANSSSAFVLPDAPWRFFHASNLLTYLLAVAGILAIRGGEHGLAWQAGAGLAITSLLDLFDGRFARSFPRTAAQKGFGVQIDSLSDSFAFGAVPVVLAALAVPGRMPYWLMFSLLLYLLCALTRLGYYNLQVGQQSGFVGVPTTLMGLMWSLLWCFRLTAPVIAVMMVAGGLSMVAPIRIPRPTPVVFYSLVALSVLLAGWHISNGLFS